MPTYQVRFPVVTVAEDTPQDAVLRALEELARLVRSGEQVPFVNRVVVLERNKRLDFAGPTQSNHDA